MRHRIGLLARLSLGGSIVFLSAVDIFSQSARRDSRQTMVAAEDFHRPMKELSNWGRWGKDDELGAANLITPAKRKQALALVTEGITVSLAHDIIQSFARHVEQRRHRLLGGAVEERADELLERP